MDYATAAHFGNYSPGSFGWSGNNDARSHRNLLVPLEYAGVGFLPSVHRDVHGLFTRLLSELVPLIPGGLVTPGCWGFSTTDDLPDGSRSFHSYGIAIDVNAPYNPMGQNNRPTGPHTLPAATSAIARKYGCEWGGDWNAGGKDWMHIECHLTPQVARSVTGPSEDDMSTDELIAALNSALNSAEGQHAIYRAVLQLDAFPNPSGSNVKANPTWALESVLTYLYRNAKTAAVQKVPSAPEIAAAVVAALPPASKGGVTTSELASAVADEIAKRMGE